MTDAADLWTAVVASYNADGLLQLTNIRNRAATSIDTAVGQSAAQGVIDVWPVYAQSAYDATNATHVEVAKRGVIAMLWSRGGTASQIAKIEWGRCSATRHDQQGPPHRRARPARTKQQQRGAAEDRAHGVRRPRARVVRRRRPAVELAPHPPECRR
jgi:hypothetical protein